MRLYRSLIPMIFLILPAWAFAQDVNRPPLVFDENIWVTFYDVPSRRFRSIRDAFVRGDTAAVSRDIEISTGFLRIEAERVPAQLVAPFAETIDSLESIRSRLGDGSVAVAQLDSTFARVHWLLSQHYLVLGITARDQSRHVMAGRYLIATAHHLERAVLWSNFAIERDVLKSLDSIRDMAGRLQSSNNPERVYRDRPMRLAARTLRAVGEQINRPVRVPALLSE